MHDEIDGATLLAGTSGPNNLLDASNNSLPRTQPHLHHMYVELMRRCISQIE